jgi:hypothetical protein
MGRRLRASNPRKAARHKAQPVEVRNIAHPTMWKTALKMAGGDPSRIVVHSWGRIEIMPPKPQ